MAFNRPEYAGSELGLVEFGGWGGQAQEIVPSHSILDFLQIVGEAVALTLLSFNQIVEYRESYLGINLLLFTQHVDELLDHNLLILRQFVIDDEGL